ncbi:4Fe-4S dicluster domain-containing protein [Desulfonatronospira sp.]|uniref:4Fe-4S dicluster domain-containing protein n=1 Tax=Desulfonatronospira sp. TaxID=1962951 RepID=UPI0025C708D6|nr:4Fe-4S dicluster domain-containing protein [Desulfonatronospira sp.]
MPRNIMKHAMLIDETICIGCHACVVACENIYEDSSFGTKRTRIEQHESRGYPYTISRFRKFMCMHCIENAPCIDICPTEAISYVEGEEGGMVVTDLEECVGCHGCIQVCPNEAPMMDDEKHVAIKCTFCAERVMAGHIPYCADACPVGAITFGNREELLEKGNARVSDLQRRGKSMAYLWGTRDTAVFYVIDIDPHIYRLPPEGYIEARKSFELPAGGAFAVAALGGAGLHRFWQRTQEVQRADKKGDLQKG